MANRARPASEAAGDLGDDVGRHVLPLEALGDGDADRDGRVEVGTRDVPDRVRHRHDGEAERQGDAEEADAELHRSAGDRGTGRWPSRWPRHSHRRRARTCRGTPRRGAAPSWGISWRTLCSRARTRRAGRAGRGRRWVRRLDGHGGGGLRRRGRPADAARPRSIGWDRHPDSRTTRRPAWPTTDPHPSSPTSRRPRVGNNTFRTTVWTGRHLQLTVMCLQPEEEIGLEVHHDRDQFLRIEEGAGRVVMGPTRDDLSFKRDVSDDDVILVPAGSWHNVTNTGDGPAAALLGLRPGRARARHRAPHQGRGRRGRARPLTTESGCRGTASGGKAASGTATRSGE